MHTLDCELFFMATLPIKTISEANSSEHWTKKRKRHKSQNLQICLLFIEINKSVPLPCLIRLTRLAPRFLDSDNLPVSMKYVRDAIAKEILGGKLGQKDSDPRIKWEYAQEKGKTKEYAVRIEIYSLSHHS
jgi:hypothetical protein